jgi:hypothetical protein
MKAIMMITQTERNSIRKVTLVALGQWAVLTGCGWLVQAVDASIEREGLRHA